MSNIQYHLHEIKIRFFYLLFSTISTFFISYNYQIEMVFLLGKPFIELQQTFIFLELTEAFYTLLKISTIITLIVIFPFFLYQLWSFFIPSYYKIERNRIFYFLLGFVCLFLVEVFFIFSFLLPKICQFLISFEMTSPVNNSGFHIDPLISVEFTARIESYVTIVVKILTVTLLFFQIPFCICLMYSKKILHVSNLYSNRKILIFVSLLFSAFLVPPDAISQLLMTFFLYFLFEFFIFIGLFFE